MSNIYIEDGTGASYKAGVTNENMLKTIAVSNAFVAHVAEDHEDTYIIGTDFISLTTTGSDNAIFYMKNTSTIYNVYIYLLRICAGGTAGNYAKAKMIANPTGGTIISEAVSANVTNSKIGSSKTATSLAYKGNGDGKTATGGSHITQIMFPIPGHAQVTYDGAIIIARGQSLALTVDPSVACEVCVSGIAYFVEA